MTDAKQEEGAAQAGSGGSTSMRSAVLLTSSSSLLVPVVGVVTLPILARALGAEGRGELTAAMAPAVLMLAAATMGLPESLTQLLGRRPEASRRGIAYASLVTTVLGVLSVGIVLVAAPGLSGGRSALEDLMVLAALITVPALVVNVLRGAASGLQLWRLVALDRVVVTLWRLVGFTALFVAGHLTVLTGVLVYALAPFAGGVVYARLLWQRFPPLDQVAPEDGRVLLPLLSFGSRLWFGSVAFMLLARTSDLLMVPLASAYELGLYAVAVALADIPILLAFAVQSSLFGVSSRSRSAERVTLTSRLTLLVAALGCGVLAAALPFAIGPLFGDEFEAALVPTLLILLRVLYGIPGLTAGTAVSAWGRPGIRSAGFAVAVVVNGIGFVLLVPSLGLYGAVLASFVTTTITNVYFLGAAKRVLGVRASDFWCVRRADVERLRHEVTRLVQGVRRRVLPTPGTGPRKEVDR